MLNTKKLRQILNLSTKKSARTQERISAMPLIIILILVEIVIRVVRMIIEEEVAEMAEALLA